MSWCFEDEASPATDLLFALVRDEGALVPGLWFLEVGNVLLQAARRGRITFDDISIRLNLISALPIVVDQKSIAFAWDDVLHLAQEQALTTYDAAYLELALRRALPLFTRDLPLAKAARQLGVSVAP